jgi:trigger factor
MKVSSEQIENSQVSLSVEMEAGEIDKYMDVAYNHLVGKYRIPGFRKGKTPRAILEQHIGHDAFMQEALEHLIPDAYEKAVVEQKINPIARAEIELIKTDPVTFKAIVPVVPTVNLGDYKAIRIAAPAIELDEKEVDNTIEKLRHQQATLKPVDRPVVIGDTVTMDVEGIGAGEPMKSRKAVVYEVLREAQLPLPNFADKLEGLEKGKEASFVLSYPPDYEIKDIAGKEYSFKVTVTEVKEKELPEVNDEFAKGTGADDLVSLRKAISERLKNIAEQNARLEYETKIVDEVIKLSEIIYPPVLETEEINKLMDEESRGFSDGVKGLENYLKAINKTIESHQEELRPIAKKRVLSALVIGKVYEAEGIKIEEAEIDEEIEKMMKDADKQADELRRLFSFPQARHSIEKLIIGRKAIERLKQIAGGSA